MLTAGIQGYHNDKINATECPKEMMMNIISPNLKNVDEKHKEAMLII